ncbi:MAG TPA: CotH kinase family protein [Bacillota bacterium]|nr:CotH kinase family protein [Bacillota bacterium]
MRQVVPIVIIILLVSAAFGWGYTSYFNAEDRSPSASVRINEVMSSNTYVISDEDGDFPDWIELYNTGTKRIDLGGWFLSSEKGSPMWEFPDNTYIRGGGHLLVWASGKNRQDRRDALHTNFKISSSKANIFLSNPNGIEVDRLKVPSLGVNMSFGASRDGAETATIFETATPGKSNEAGGLYRHGLDSPVFSHKGGFYRSDFSLALASKDVKTVIRYTLDGSEPDENSQIYAEPIAIADRSEEPNMYTDIHTSLPRRSMEINKTKKATVVRARVYKEGYEPSSIATHTYFIGPDIKNRYGLPIVALTTDSDNLFDDEKGIYVPGATFNSWQLKNPSMMARSSSSANYSQRGRAWERPAHLEYYDSMGQLRTAQDAGVRIHGRRTSSKAQKSLRLYARSEYDSQNVFALNIFDNLQGAGTGEPISEYKRLVLRNSGDDWEHAMMRDSLMQGLVANRDIATLASRPVVVFLNGEFWGIHYIQERLDRFYLESHYGANPDKVVVLENNGVLDEGYAGDEAPYFEMLDFILSHDVSMEENYAYLNSLLDIDNYLDYFVINSYYNNVDWPHNNVRLWRYKSEDLDGEDRDIDKLPVGAKVDQLDGRWRFILYDTDMGFGLGEDTSFNMLEWALQKESPASGDQWPATIILALLENEGFRHEFINRFADYMNTSFKTDVVTGKIDQISDEIMPSMEDHLARWALHGGSVDKWQENVNDLRTFAKDRPAYMKQHLEDRFGLDGRVNISIENQNPRAGFVRLNSINISENTPGVEDHTSFTGEYFKEVPIVMTPQAMPGYEFNGWIGIDGNQDIEVLGDSLRISPKGDITITATFKQVPMRTLTSAIVIAVMGTIAVIIISALLRLLPIRKWRLVRQSNKSSL